jgi:eukaryotic-like serine/threonine-protein kinase
MTIQAGKRLGPYEIVDSLGAGGMGEVWRASDTRLDREVAIKVLPAGFAENAEFLQRFEREARAISSLNHPHICTLHDVGQDDATHYLVMELMEGESLADRLKKGPLPLHEVLRYGRQIASALDAAHRRGVIHRDLKPGNIMLTKSGAKLLDFGLAKSAAGGQGVIGGLTSLPTEHKPLTQEGTILGTFQYMAPEQLEGLEADARTDIFALGTVLYEMATGRRAFLGGNKTSLIAAIVSSQPEPISNLTAMAPPALDHVVRRCLEKDPDDRWQSAHDIASELQWISEAGSQAGVASAVTIRRKTREKLAWTIAALAITAAVVLGAIHFLEPEPDVRTIQADILPVPGSSFVLAGEAAGTITISPDGRFVTWLGRGEDGKRLLWLRPLNSRQARPIPGTENARYPFWSPDSRFIAFFTDRSLMKVDTQGGPPLELTTIGVNPRRGSWNQSDVILFSPSSLESIYSVPATGGTPTPVTKIDAGRGETTHRWATFLPDGRHFLYMAGTHTAGTRSEINAIYVGDLEHPENPKLLVRARSNAEYADGHLLYVRDGVLVAHPFDLDELTLHGAPFPVAEGVQYSPGFFHGVFAVASNGTLVYRIARESNDTRIERVDASGAVLGLVREAKEYQQAALSPDGKRLAVSIVDPQVGNGDIWIVDLERDVSTRFTFDPSDEGSPLWSPDGSRIVFTKMHEGTYSLFEKSASGDGGETLIVKNDLHLFPTDWHRDGSRIAIMSYDPAANLSADLQVLDLEERVVSQLLATSFDEIVPKFSPDGLWMSYISNESGRNELYVSPFPGPGGKWQISSAEVTAGSVFWGADGRSLYYATEDGARMIVEINARGAALEIGSPRTLFSDSSIVGWLPERGKNTFLVFRGVEQSLEAPITLVTNWASSAGR